MSVWGIMGGAFNPIHYGHLFAAQEALHTFQLEKVLFIPTGVPPHKQMKAFPSSNLHRMKMTELAICGNAHFQALDLEIKKPEKSYTYDTVMELRDLYPQVHFSFITGADSLLNYEWHRFDELLAVLSFFICVSRPGFDLSELAGRIDELKLQNKDKIKILSVVGMEISSTDIRTRISCGAPVQYLLPDNVIDYIIEKRLYR